VSDVARYDVVDFLTDASLVDDPYPYYSYLRECPVRSAGPHGMVTVTGWEEGVEVWRDIETFSSCNAFGGPFPGLPVEIESDDIGDLIEQYRDVYPISEHFVTFDPPTHAMHRGLMMRLMTPKRLEENEAFMWALSDRLLDAFAADGACEFTKEYAHPFALLNIADLLGVPEQDHARLRTQFESYTAGALTGKAGAGPFAFLDDVFVDYVEDRRRSPRDDVMTKLALATFPDGSMPEVIDVVRIAAFLFAAGQGTTAHMMASLLQRLATRPELQARVRDDRSLVMPFVEETLRLESPTKVTFRLARRSTELVGVPVPAGTTLMIMPGAINRDARHFEQPDELDVERANARDHVAFGRGIHACPGQALARTEARVSLNRILDRLDDIRLSDAEHGPAGAHEYHYNPSFMLRGLQALHLEFTIRS
jgi:cytochrome P450